jgi:hypothetical protein
MPIKTRKVITICTEDSPGYPDPLIYVMDVPLNASADEIKEMVIQERIDELGDELADEVRETFQVCMAWPGEVDPLTYLFDHRI